MQDITPPLAATAQLIQSYGPGGFRIGNANYTSPVLVLPHKTMAWSGELTPEALSPLIASTHEAEPTEILLIGTGARHEMVSHTLRAAMRELGIGVDSMDTGAACRTFNILLGEGRRVAVALLLAA